MYLRKIKFFLPIFLSLLFVFGFVGGLAHATVENSLPNQPNAATITVCAEGCAYTSIQEAINNADPGDIIDLASETYTETLWIDESITLIGDGAENTIIQAASAPGIAASRVVMITGDVSATIQGVTIQYGVDTTGGGIYNQGTMTLTQCTVISNTATTGGGLYNRDNLGTAIAKLNNTTISGNTANVYGGGIFNNANEGTTTANLILTNTTISGNTANNGGGIFNNAILGTAIVNLTNTTISGNTASSTGGGIFNYVDEGTATANLTNTTVSGNTAILGGGIYNFANSGTATYNLTNSILANSPSGGDCSAFGGMVNNNGLNIVEDNSCGFTGGSDPKIGPLQDNGGPTWTHALLSGSLAINTGDCSGGTISTDQRGITRPQGSACDIGAYEVEEGYLVFIPLVLK